MTVRCMGPRRQVKQHVPMTGGGDKIEHDVNTVISETRVTLDTRFHRKNVIVLLLHKPEDLREASGRLLACPNCADPRVIFINIPGLVVYLISEPGCVDDSQGNACSFIVQFQLCDQVLDTILPNYGLSCAIPTVTGLILTPSSTWAVLGSSDCLWARTVLPQSVFTKVVRPVGQRETVSFGELVMKQHQFGWNQTYQYPRHHRPSGRTESPS